VRAITAARQKTKPLTPEILKELEEYSKDSPIFELEVREYRYVTFLYRKGSEEPLGWIVPDGKEAGTGRLKVNVDTEKARYNAWLDLGWDVSVGVEHFNYTESTGVCSFASFSDLEIERVSYGDVKKKNSKNLEYQLFLQKLFELTNGGHTKNIVLLSGAKQLYEASGTLDTEAIQEGLDGYNRDFVKSTRKVLVDLFRTVGEDTLNDYGISTDALSQRFLESWTTDNVSFKELEDELKSLLSRVITREVISHDYKKLKSDLQQVIDSSHDDMERTVISWVKNTVADELYPKALNELAVPEKFEDELVVYLVEEASLNPKDSYWLARALPIPRRMKKEALYTLAKEASSDSKYAYLFAKDVSIPRCLKGRILPILAKGVANDPQYAELLKEMFQFLYFSEEKYIKRYYRKVVMVDTENNIEDSGLSAYRELTINDSQEQINKAITNVENFNKSFTTSLKKASNNNSKDTLVLLQNAIYGHVGNVAEHAKDTVTGVIKATRDRAYAGINSERGELPAIDRNTQNTNKPHKRSLWDKVLGKNKNPGTSSSILATVEARIETRKNIQSYTKFSKYLNKLNKNRLVNTRGSTFKVTYQNIVTELLRYGTEDLGINGLDAVKTKTIPTYTATESNRDAIYTSFTENLDITVADEEKRTEFVEYLKGLNNTLYSSLDATARENIQVSAKDTLMYLVSKKLDELKA